MNLNIKRYKSREKFLEEFMNIELTPFQKMINDAADKGELKPIGKPRYKPFSGRKKNDSQ